MKKLITPVFLFLTIISFSQSVTRVALTIDEVKELKNDVTDGFFVSTTKMDKSIERNTMNYDYDIIYKGKVVFRGVLDKPTGNTASFGSRRNEIDFCLDYAILDAETKLELLERKSGNWNKIMTKEKKPYMCIGRYKLFSFESGDEPRLNLSKHLKLKFYKLLYR